MILISEAFEKAVDAPRSASRGCDVKEDEAVEDRGVTAVEGRVGAFRRMDHPVGDGHVACEDEGDEARKKPEKKKSAANDFDDALPPEKRKELRIAVRWRRRKPEKLLRPVFDKDEGRDDPQKTKEVRSKPVS